jgi:RNA 2',3'-cyclic 3'-phosphodiesterase
MITRLFIGIPASFDIQSKALELKNANKDFQVRWIKPRNLHITLVPPWQAGGSEIGEIIKILKAQPSVEPFYALFNRIDLGPNYKDPRLIWTSGDAPNQLLDLRQTIHNSITTFIHDREFLKYSFKMHMTLARFQRASLPRWAEVLFDISWPMLVNRFVLYKSNLKPEGAEYEILEEFALHK